MLIVGIGGCLSSRAGGTTDRVPALVPTQPGSSAATLEVPIGPAPAASPAGAAVAGEQVSGARGIVVHVAGAVRNPGVYRFRTGDRIGDAVHAAGGFKDAADRDALNLADTLRDADQVYVPLAEKAAVTPGVSAAAFAGPVRHRRPVIVRGSPAHPAAPVDAPLIAEAEAPPQVVERVPGRVLGRPVLPIEPSVAPDDGTDATPGPPDAGTPAISSEPGVPTTPLSAAVSKRMSGKKTRGPGRSSGKGGKSGKFKNPGDGVVHLNSATAALFEQLPGVGPAMSGRIVEYRTQIGKFADVSQLLDVKGVGQKKFAKMQPFLAL